jgi:hypothetical protein
VCTGKMRNSCYVFVGNPEGEIRPGSCRPRCEDNIKMDLQETGRVDVDRIHLAQDRDEWRAVVNTVMNFRVPWKAGNFLTCLATMSFSRNTLFHGVSLFSWFTLECAGPSGRAV